MSKSRMRSESSCHDPLITKEIKRYGIHFRNELGDWLYMPPKHIKFINNGKEMICKGYHFNVLDDINTMYIITKEDM